MRVPPFSESNRTTPALPIVEPGSRSHEMTRLGTSFLTTAFHSVCHCLIVPSSLRNAVSDVRRCDMARAVGAAEKVPVYLDAMADYLAIAMLANWRHRMDRTFEAVKCVSCSRSFYCESFVVFVPANFALCHTTSCQLLMPG